MKRATHRSAPTTDRRPPTTALSALIATVVAIHPLAAAQWSYLDATTGNTTLANGTPLTLGSNLTQSPDGGPNDGRWHFRTHDTAVGEGVFTANEVVGDEDPPLLVTTVTNLVPGQAYNCVAVFQSRTDEWWCLRAGFDASNQTLFARANHTDLDGEVAATPVDFAEYTGLADPNTPVQRTLYQGALGTTCADSNGHLRVYVDDPGDVQNGDDSPAFRTWYEGIGYHAAETPHTNDIARYNVLFICIDDLRPETRAYGQPYMITPNLDRLAESGRLFQHHYCQSPTCGASRYALLTGLRYSPTSSDNSNNDVMWGKRPSVEPPVAWTMPDLFQRNGYRTMAVGKVSHSADGYHYGYTDMAIPADPAHEEMPFSWDRIIIPPSFTNKWGTGWKAFFAYANGSTRTPGVSPPMEAGDPDANPAPLYPDIDIADSAIGALRELRTNRFFLAVGFYKPHLPFNAPRKYYDLYNPTNLPFAPFAGVTAGADPRSLVQSGEVTGNYSHAPQPSNWHNLTNSSYHAELRRAYFACVSYVDAQVGRVLDELERLKLNTNTVVVVWGDHGWHLGDNNLWGKHTKFERAARSALIMRVPGMRFPGRPTQALVESLDLYPTLADVCGLRNVPATLDGVSLRPVLDDPQHPGKEAAITYWNPASSVRTDRYRFVYYHNDGAEELYDHAVDPYEATNTTALHADVVSNLVTVTVSNAPAMRPAPDHYGTWVTNHFQPTQLGDPATVGRLADPDGDGSVNAFEYFYGTNPTSAAAATAFAPSFVDADSNRYFSMTFPRSVSATDLRSTIDASADLATWEGIDPDNLAYRVTRVVEGNVEILTIRDTRQVGADPRRYMRLRLNWEP